MKLIVGLGNPGEKYTQTRHNLGFMVIERFLKDFEAVSDTVWINNSKLKSDVVLIDWQPKVSKPERIILAKPKTYMNNSGLAVGLISTYYKIALEDIWIVHDDLDLTLGKMKIRFGGAAAGHHGVESIMEKLASDKFWRFRLGTGLLKYTTSHMAKDGEEIEEKIARKNINNTTDFVLGTFSSKEKSEVKKLIKYGSEALQVALEKGIEPAMNRFNIK
jgi:peptidyl-tRNA hydrolase, PTH1 family